jgi:hypothetical protein
MRNVFQEPRNRWRVSATMLAGLLLNLGGLMLIGTHSRVTAAFFFAAAAAYAVGTVTAYRIWRRS